MNADTTGGYEAVSTPERITAKRSEKRQLAVMVGVRFTPEEHAALVAEAAAQGVSVPELLRRAFGVMRYMKTIQEATNGA